MIETRFTNTYKTAYDIRNYEEEGEVNIYIGNDKENVLQAFYLDQEDQAGELFEIPCCCGKYFRDNWQEAKDKYQSDLFRKLILDSDEKETKIPW